jgi:hypothetical protein
MVNFFPTNRHASSNRSARAGSRSAGLAKLPAERQQRATLQERSDRTAGLETFFKGGAFSTSRRFIMNFGHCILEVNVR